MRNKSTQGSGYEIGGRRASPHFLSVLTNSQVLLYIRQDGEAQSPAIGCFGAPAWNRTQQQIWLNMNNP